MQTASVLQPRTAGARVQIRNAIDDFGVLSALAIGWIVFREWPVQRIFPGVLFIVGAGLAIILRERRASRHPA